MSKVVITGNASGTGDFTIAAPNSNTDRTLTLPDEAGTVLTSASSLAAANLSGSVASSAMPAGSVLQVVSTTKTDTFSQSSLTFGDVTGLSVSITPSSTSSKILVFGTINCSQASDFAYVRVMRDSTAIAIGDAASNRVRATASTGYSTNNFYIYALSTSHLDAPSSTSALTYKWQIRSGSAATAAYVNRSVSDRDTANYEPRNSSNITVMEIAG